MIASRSTGVPSSVVSPQAGRTGGRLGPRARSSACRIATDAMAASLSAASSPPGGRARPCGSSRPARTTRLCTVWLAASSTSSEVSVALGPSGSVSLRPSSREIHTLATSSSQPPRQTSAEARRSMSGSRAWPPGSTTTSRCRAWLVHSEATNMNALPPAQENVTSRSTTEVRTEVTTELRRVPQA